jgi:hypothetical protein
MHRVQLFVEQYSGSVLRVACTSAYCVTNVGAYSILEFPHGLGRSCPMAG